MKTLSILITFLAGATLALGQRVIPGSTYNPGQVRFQNTETSKAPGVTSHLVTNVTGTLLVGTQYMAELYYLDTITSSLTPMTATISHFYLSTTARPGTWNGPALLSPLPNGYGGIDTTLDENGDAKEAGDGTGNGAGYYPVTLAVRVWDSTTGSSYETATISGTSGNFQYLQRFTATIGGPVDVQMVAQPSFRLVPEPSAIALSLLGVAGLFFLRRRKS